MLNLFKKETEEDKIRTEITNTEFKKNSMISTVNNEKAQLEQEKRNFFTEMGETVYNNHKERISVEDFAETFEKIKGLEQQMTEKEAKIVEIAARYDEEINLLSANLVTIQQQAQAAAAPVATAAPAAAGGFCENCGTAHSGQDAFCQGCGTKIKN